MTVVFSWVKTQLKAGEFCTPASSTCRTIRLCFRPLEMGGERLPSRRVWSLALGKMGSLLWAAFNH